MSTVADRALTLDALLGFSGGEGWLVVSPEPELEASADCPSADDFALANACIEIQRIAREQEWRALETFLSWSWWSLGGFPLGHREAWAAARAAHRIGWLGSASESDGQIR